MLKMQIKFVVPQWLRDHARRANSWGRSKHPAIPFRTMESVRKQLRKNRHA